MAPGRAQGAEPAVSLLLRAVYLRYDKAVIMTASVWWMLRQSVAIGQIRARARCRSRSCQALGKAEQGDGDRVGGPDEHGA